MRHISVTTSNRNRCYRLTFIKLRYAPWTSSNVFRGEKMAGGAIGDPARRWLPVKYRNDARDRCSVVSGDYKKAPHATITPRTATSLYARHIYGRD